MQGISVSNDVIQWISRNLSRDPNSRHASAKEALSAFSDSFIKTTREWNIDRDSISLWLMMCIIFGPELISFAAPMLHNGGMEIFVLHLPELTGQQDSLSKGDAKNVMMTVSKVVILGYCCWGMFGIGRAVCEGMEVFEEVRHTVRACIGGAITVWLLEQMLIAMLVP